uniref:Importin N-terminal domain-containing protein n=1 Tax=Arcella intermedia TaxID=1963864 RepID=A0A6B2KX94_9EUKA
MEEINKIILEELFLSTNVETRNQATHTLMEAQRTPGYLNYLWNFISSPNDNIKNCVLIQWRQTVEQYWTLKDNYVLSNQEKVEIRSKLLSLITETRPMVSGAVESMLSHIISIDFPDLWPDVFQMMATAAAKQSNPCRILQVIYLCIQKIVKELQKAVSKQNDGNIAFYYKRWETLKLQSLQLFTIVSPIWQTKNTEMLALLSNYSQGSVQKESLSIELGRISHFSLKVIKILLREFLPQFASQNEETLVNLFAHMSQMTMKSIQCFLVLKDSTICLVPYVQKTCFLYMKIFSQSQRNHPLTFTAMLKNFLDFYYALLNTNYPRPDCEKLLVHILNFLSDVLTSREYLSPYQDLLKCKKHIKQEELSEEKVKIGQSTLRNFFDKDKLLSIVRILISRYLIMSEKAIEAWKEDPEEFLEEELSESHKFKLIPATEYLFHRILRYYPGIGVPLFDIIRDTLTECNMAGPNNFEAILLKDACYYAFALTVPAASNIDFKKFFFEFMAKEFSVSYPNAFIIKRRVAYVTELWASEISDFHKDVYRMCIACLDDRDMLVQVYGATTLRAILEDFDIRDEKYLEFIKPSVQYIVALVKKMSGSSTTCHILKIISLVIQELKEQVRPHMDLIVECVSSLWEVSQQKKMVLASIITILSKLVEVLIGGAAELELKLIPIISICSETAYIKDVPVLDEILDLWGNVIEQMPYLTPQLLQLYPKSLLVAKENIEDPPTLRKILHITEAYILIGKEQFYKQHFESLVSNLTIALSNMYKPHHIIDTIELIEIMVRVVKIEPVTAINTLLRTCWNLMIRKFSQKDMEEPVGYGLVLFGRIFLTNEGKHFIDFFSNWNPNEWKNQFVKFVEMLITMDTNSVPVLSNRKILVLVMSKLLTLSEPLLVPHIPVLAERCITLIHSIARDKKKKSGKFSRRNGMITNSPCFRAKRQLENNDDYDTTNEMFFFQSHFNQVLQTHPSPSLQKLLQDFHSRFTDK